MDDKQLKLLCVSIIAAGMRANEKTMEQARNAAEHENSHTERNIAMWALTTFEFIEDVIRIDNEELKR